MSNSNRFTITQENWALFADSTQIGSDPILPLIDGGVARTSWAAFTEGANGDGFGTFLGGDETDLGVLDARVPARVVTAWQNDIDDVDYIDVAAHPYPGITANSEVNTFEIFMYLNGGPPVKAAVRERQGKHGNDNYYVYSCAVPQGLTGSNEVRVVVIPAYGKATILQNTMVAGKLNVSLRGCLLHEYTSDVTVGPTGTYATVTDAVNGEGTTAVRCTLSGAAYEEGSIFTLADAGYNNTTLVQDDVAPYPILKSDGSGVVIASDLSAQSWGFIVDGCQVYVKPDPADPGSNIRNPRNSGVGFIYDNNARAKLLCFRNCTGGIKNDTTAYPEIPSTTHGDALIAKGLAIPMLQFYRGNLFKVCSLNMAIVNGDSSYYPITTQENCDWLLTCRLASESIDTRTVNPPSGYDVYNSNLSVGCSDQGTSKYQFPWGSISGDVVDDPFTFDYTQRDFDSTLDYNEVNSKSRTADAHNLGVWPDWLANSNTKDDMTAEPWIDNGDGTYTDHHGHITTGWPFPWTTGQDPHFDTYQMTNRTATGPAVFTGHRALGDNRTSAGIFATAFNLDGWCLGVWDMQWQNSVSAQPGISVGIDGGDDPPYTNPGPAQHWGPDVYYATVDGPDARTVADHTGAGIGQLYLRTSNPNIAAWQNLAGVGTGGYRLKFVD